MRYSLTEGCTILGKFTNGDTVTISLYKLSDSSSVTLISNSCSQISTTGVFKWASTNITTQPTAFTEYVWIMTNGTTSQYGKIVLGGYPDNADMKISDIPTAVENRQEMDSNSTKLANLDTTISSRMATFTYTAPDNTSIGDIKTEVLTHPNLTEIEASTVLAKEATLTTINTLVTRALGLSQENYRIKDPVYNTNNDLLSSTIEIFANASDCEADTSPTASYSVVATYDTSNRLLTYKVVKN